MLMVLNITRHFEFNQTKNASCSDLSINRVSVCDLNTYEKIHLHPSRRRVARGLRTKDRNRGSCRQPGSLAGNSDQSG